MTQKLTVKGMTCGHCEQTVEEALEEVEGVSSAKADREAETVTVEGDTDADTLVDAVSEAGYEASA